MQGYLSRFRLVETSNPTGIRERKPFVLNYKHDFALNSVILVKLYVTKGQRVWTITEMLTAYVDDCMILIRIIIVIKDI